MAKASPSSSPRKRGPSGGAPDHPSSSPRKRGPSGVPDDPRTGAPPSRTRIDKWLWAARFYKTRTLAAQAVDAGQVRINAERVKPAHLVGPGASVEVRKAALAWTVAVTATSERRGSATDAALLYRETAESAAKRAQAMAERAAAAATRGSGRPTKKDRRKLEDFLNEP